MTRIDDYLQSIDNCIDVLKSNELGKRQLITADLHIHNPTEWNQDIPTQNTSKRLENFADMLEYIIRAAIEKECDSIIIAGDFIHTYGLLNVKVYHKINNVIKNIKKERPIRIIALLGNHDIAIKSSPQINWVNSFYGVEVISKPLVHIAVNGTGTSHIFIPFCTRKYFLDIVEKIKPVFKIMGREEDTKILVSHLPIREGILSESGRKVHQEFKVEDFDYFEFCFLGDYHRMQFIEPNILYVGSPIQHNFGEEGNTTGYWVHDLRDEKLDYFLLEDFPKFHSIELKTEKDLEKIKAWRTKDYKKISTQDPKLYDMAKALHSNAKIHLLPTLYKKLERLPRIEKNSDVIREYLSTFSGLNRVDEKYEIAKELLGGI